MLSQQNSISSLTIKLYSLYKYKVCFEHDVKTHDFQFILVLFHITGNNVNNPKYGEVCHFEFSPLPYRTNRGVLCSVTPKYIPIGSKSIYKYRRCDLTVNGKKSCILFLFEETPNNARILNRIMNDQEIHSFTHDDIVDIDENDDCFSPRLQFVVLIRDRYRPNTRRLNTKAKKMKRP